MSTNIAKNFCRESFGGIAGLFGHAGLSYDRICSFTGSKKRSTEANIIKLIRDNEQTRSKDRLLVSYTQKKSVTKQGSKNCPKGCTNLESYATL